MQLHARLLFLLLLLIPSSHTEEEESCAAAGGDDGGCDGGGPNYRAAVVEYGPPAMANGTSKDYLRKVMKEYEVIIRRAKRHGADVVVFPEYGLAPPGVLEGASHPREILRFVQEVPKEGQWKKDKRFRSELVRSLSVAAAANSVYVVAGMLLREKCNLTEPDCNPDLHFRYHNAAVAFDRGGKLVATYRKNHLYAEELNILSSTPEPDVAYFDTDFGERIGLLVCFDMAFEEPARTLIQEKKVSTIAFLTSWVDEVPFLTALQFHPGWSAAHGVTLLSSGRHMPAIGAMGSGVYADGGIANYTFQPTEARRKIVYADVGRSAVDDEDRWTKQDPFVAASAGGKSKMVQRLMLEEDLSSYKWEKLDGGGGSLRIELDEKSSCALEYKFSDRRVAKGSYALVGFRGRRPFGGGAHRLGVDVCGVVFCKEEGAEDLSSCGKVVEAGDFDVTSSSPTFETLLLSLRHPASERPVPVSLDARMQPLDPRTDVEYGREGKTRTELSLRRQVEDVYSVGLFARVYKMDSKKSKKR